MSQFAIIGIVLKNEVILNVMFDVFYELERLTCSLVIISRERIRDTKILSVMTDKYARLNSNKQE